MFVCTISIPYLLVWIGGGYKLKAGVEKCFNFWDRNSSEKAGVEKVF